MERPRTPGAGTTGAETSIKLGGAIGDFISPPDPSAQSKNAYLTSRADLAGC